MLLCYIIASHRRGIKMYYFFFDSISLRKTFLENTHPLCLSTIKINCMDIQIYCSDFGLTSKHFFFFINIINKIKLGNINVKYIKN